MFSTAKVSVEQSSEGALTRFFCTVLPASGRAVIATADGGFRHRFFANRQEAARYALAQDAQGKTVYFGCHAYGAANDRTAANVVACRSFFLDIDCGLGKPYPSQADALRALAAFRHKLGLTAPFVVNSGNGVHAYWPMSEDMPPATWLAAARLLRNACAAEGLAADHHRTADLASVLRPPGVHNRKAEPKLVQLIFPRGVR